MTKKRQIRHWYPLDPLSARRKGFVQYGEPGGPAPYLDKTAWLRGWPGYRTRPGRSGLDLIDTRAEWAHMQGRFFHALSRGSLRTRDPFHLTLMAVSGVVCTLPLAAILIMLLQGEWLIVAGASPVYIPIGLLGVGLLWDLSINLKEEDEE